MTKGQKAKELPSSKESEMMVLGTMLTNQDALKIGADSLNDSDFYFADHRTIFQVMKECYRKDTAIDVHIACEALKGTAKLSAVGGVAYVTTLAQYAGTSAHVEEYAKIVKDLAVRRRAIDVAGELARLAQEEPKDVQRIIEKIQRDLTDIARRCSIESDASVGEIFSGAKSRDTKAIVNKLKERQDYFEKHNKPFPTGISTGFADLDKETTILERMNLVVIAGRPAMGKTAFALNIADNVSRQGKPIGFISLEMSKEQLSERMLSIHTKISGENLKRGEFSDTELSSLEHEAEELAKTPFYIIDNHCETIAQVISGARRLKDKKHIELLVIDYLQLLSVDGGADSRQYEVAEISRRLKTLAMELEIPVIAISQLSRKVEERTDKRPQLSDLRDSGQIEQDADVALFVYRPSYYDKNDKPGQAEILVRKNRNGSIAEISLNFDQGSGKFNALEPLKSLF